MDYCGIDSKNRIFHFNDDDDVCLFVLSKCVMNDDDDDDDTFCIRKLNSKPNQWTSRNALRHFSFEFDKRID